MRDCRLNIINIHRDLIIASPVDVLCLKLAFRVASRYYKIYTFSALFTVINSFLVNASVKGLIVRADITRSSDSDINNLLTRRLIKFISHTIKTLLILFLTIERLLKFVAGACLLEQHQQSLVTCFGLCLTLNFTRFFFFEIRRGRY